MVGPEGIGPLAAALANASDGITRLLLGNNIIGELCLDKLGGPFLYVLEVK